MRDLNYYAAECMRELDLLKIKYSKDVSFKINTRAVTRLGVCKKTGSNYVIEISSSLLDERTDLKNGLKNTIMHELLHTCRGCMKHTGKWKELAARVNCAYGYNIQRTATPEEKLIPSELAAEPKYVVKCESCGCEFARHRMSAIVKSPGRYRCGKCGGGLKRVL